MYLLLSKEKAQNLLKELIQEGSRLYYINPLTLAETKPVVNEWYQKVIKALKEIFDDPKDIINEMNKVLEENKKYMISPAVLRKANLYTDEIKRDTELFIKKIKNIVSILEKVSDNLSDTFM